MIVTIYALCCPFSGEIRYVGKTVNTKNRLVAAHIERRANLRAAAGLPPFTELQKLQNAKITALKSAQKAARKAIKQQTAK